MLPVLKQAMLWPPKEAQTWTQKALTQKALIQMPLIQMLRALKIRTRWLQEFQRRQLILTQAVPKVWKKGANLALKTGMAEGRAAGSAEASAQLERAIQAFETATASLKDLTEVDSNALSAGIRAAILQLASARAGQVISDMPAAFVSRIEDMISKIRTVTGEPVIRLNSADLAAVAPLIETREKLRHCHFVADNDLASGDLSVTVGNIGIDDFLLQGGELDNRADNSAMSAALTQPSRGDASGGAPTIDDNHQQDTNEVMVAEQVAEPLMTDGDAEQAAAKPETSKGNMPESDAAKADESLGDVSAEGADAAPANPAPADPELADLTPADMPFITAETAGEADDD